MIETFGAVTLFIIIFKYWTYKLYMMLIIIVKPTQLSYTNQLCILHCCAMEPIRYAFLFWTSFLWNAHTHTNHLLLSKLLAVLVQIERPDVLDPPELVSGTELTLNHLNDLCTVFEECRWKEVVCNVCFVSPVTSAIISVWFIWTLSCVCWVKNTLLVLM